MSQRSKKTSSKTSPEAPQKPATQQKKGKKHPTGVIILNAEPRIRPSSVKKFGKSGLTNDEAQFVFDEFLGSKSKTIGEFAHELLSPESGGWDDEDGTYPYSRVRAEAIMRDILDEFVARDYLTPLPPETPYKPPKAYKRLKEDLDCPADTEKFGQTGIDNARAHLIWATFKTSTHETLEDFAHELYGEGQAWNDYKGTNPYSKRKAASYLQDIIDEFQKRGMIE